MRSQLIAVLGSSFVLLTRVGSAPAPQYGGDDCVNITTIYVTIPLPVEAFDSSMETTSTVDLTATTPISKALPPASLEPSAVITITIGSTKSVEETIDITQTLIQPTETGTKTKAIDFSSSLVTSSKGDYSLLPETDQTSNLETFDILGPSAFTVPSTTISYIVDIFPSAITSVAEAPITSAFEPSDSLTNDIVTVYETIPVIPLPVGYTGPIPTGVETFIASKIAIKSDATSTSQIFTTSSTLHTSVSVTVSSASSTSAVGPTVLPNSGSQSFIGTDSWNSTSCTDFHTKTVSDTVGSHTIALPSFSVSDSPLLTSITSSPTNPSNPASLNYGIVTGYSPSIFGTTEFDGIASSTSTLSFTFVYPTFLTGTLTANTYLTISLSLSSSISESSPDFTTSGSIIDDSGLITSGVPSTSSSGGGAFKSTADDGGFARTSSEIHTVIANSTFIVPSISVSRSTINDSGLATTSTIIANTVASSIYTVPSSSTSGSVIDESSTTTTSSAVIFESTINESGFVTSSLEVISTTTTLVSIFAASSSTSLPEVSYSSASTFVTSTVDSSSGNRSGLSSTKVTSTVSSSVSPISCGELGDFTLDFDDLPPLAAPSDTADPMPIFSPYHQFYFDAGFVVVPPPTDPYLPASGKLLLEYIPMEGRENFGEVSNDYTELTGCFNFNARGASLGCDSRGPDCDWSITGLRYNFTTKVEDQVAAQILSTTACPALKDCTLIPVTFDDAFNDLTSLLIKGTVAGVEEIWWMDSIDLSWFDNSCTKGRCRAGFHGMGP